MDKKVLVIEDDTAEAIYAQTELARAGFEGFRAVTTLSEGLEVMPEYDAVLSDLFFPAGSESTEKYSQRFSPLYEQYKQKRFQEIEESGPVLRAVQACAEAFDVTPHEYVNKFMAEMNTPRQVLDSARDALAGVQDSERYEKFLKIEEGIRNGTDLPLGIIASERAKELGIPSAIVTSTHHHDDAFEAVRNLVTVPYRDTLVDGKKDWDGGIELLLG
jgi:CheY-like chemotaxis protein